MSAAQTSKHTQVCTFYKGTNICVQIVPNQSALLLIGGIPRQGLDMSTTTAASIQLSSTLQTDYEWHEYILAIVEFGQDTAIVKILANNQLIESKEISL